MHGTFNGIQLRRITSRKILKTRNGVTLSSFRVSEPAPALEEKLRLGAPGLLILSDEVVEGKIVHFSADAKHGYEVTIEVATGSGRASS
jgi:hypothetical protein